MQLRKLTLALGILSAISLGVPSDCEAGLFSWLFGPPRYQRWTAYQVQGFPVANTCDCSPTVMQRRVVNYLPQTRYRTQWAAVPVTQYRPVVGLDSASGCQVTYMRPCTTYNWQARRVPVVSMRPVYSTVLMPSARNYVPTTTTAAPGCSSCGVGATVGTAPLNAAPLGTAGTPYYGGATSSVPGATVAPRGIQGGIGPVPSLSPGGVGTGTPSGTTPADRPPVLPRGSVVPGQGNGLGAVRGSAAGETSQQRPTGRTGQPAAARLQNLRPVPDPDAAPTQTEPAPMLLNPHDKVTRRPQPRAWRYVPITWPTPVARRHSSPPPKPLVKTPARSTLDDTGWTSLRGARNGELGTRN